ncbi:MAG: protein kinase domain-containing protein [Gemmatimonadales bacterium]
MLDRLNASLADRYAVDRQLGRGGMASVWLARDLRHDRWVALKVLHPELAGAIGVDRFIREIRLTAGLQHPGIVPVLDSGSFPGPDSVMLPWYAMAFVDGESLRQRLLRDRHLPVDEAIRITEQAASALDAAHRVGIVHRDIKPENLMLAGGRVFLTDFGIAKALIETGGERLTSTGLAIGTPTYMSPEQATAMAVDARTDQYSLACVLYEMLAGEPPFTGPTAQAIVARRMAEPARSLRPVRSSVPPAVEAAVLRGLERLPTDRFPDVASFAAALRSGEAAPAADRAPRMLLRAVVAAVLLVALALAGWAISGRRGSAKPVRDSVAVALYQRGMLEFRKRTPAGLSAAMQAFGAAIQRDSTWAEPWAGLALNANQGYGRGFVFAGMARDSVLRLAVAASDRALALDPDLPSAWLARGAVSRQVDPTDVSPSIRSLRKALSLDSTLAQAWQLLALGLAETGDLDQALPAWRRAVLANPANAEHVAFLAIGHYWRRRPDSAMRWADSAIAINPGYLLGRSTAGYAALELENFPRAEASFEAGRRLGTDVEVVNNLAGEALVVARAGRPAEARGILATAESLAAAYSPTSLHAAVNLAQAWAALGEADHAIAWLQQYSPAADLHFQLHLRCDPPFDAVAADPRFRTLLMMPRPEAPGGC